MATTDPTPDEIAARVMRSKAHGALESELARHRATRDELLRQRTALVAGDAHQWRHEIADVGARLEVLEHRIDSARRDLVPHRAEQAERLTLALAPFRQATAARITELVAGLTDALETLGASAAAVERVAGPGMIRRLPIPRGLIEMGATAARIAATGR